ncbi:MAG: glycosyltransferase family 2 protein [Alphaproteobacteria bacterium]|nr:MAG: glycosyltransferase family 2 protein [Alphaproteobacteria bacterium]
MAAVTVIVATYNRPQLLRHTVQSIIDQTFRDWILLVVGDQCTPETAEMMASIDDPRVFYENLPVRCGEQSGPNSAGWYTAASDYVAFANHDDIWLPDHLERAVAALGQADAELYMGATIFTAADKRDGHPVFREQSPADRDLRQAYFNIPTLFEPISSWVTRRDLIQKVGLFFPAGQLHRTPVEQWVLRAWRAGVRCHFDDTVTSIYCNAEKDRKAVDAAGSIYDNTDAEGAYWLAQLAVLGLEGLREQIATEPSKQPGTWTFFEPPYRSNKPEVVEVFDALLTDATAELYRTRGWDGYNAACTILDRTRGANLARMLQRRTGAGLPLHKDWKAVSVGLRDTLANDTRWRRMNGDE